MTRHIALAHSARPGPAGARWHWPNSTGRKWGSNSPKWGWHEHPPLPLLRTLPIVPVQPSWLKMIQGTHGDEERGGCAICLFMGWLPRSHAYVLLHWGKHQLMPTSPRFCQIKTNLQEDWIITTDSDTWGDTQYQLSHLTPAATQADTNSPPLKKKRKEKSPQTW